MNILIADDDPVACKILQRQIEALGHDCVIAADGEEAWAILQKMDIDVLISDWMMPRVDGLELCRRVRTLRRTGYTYVILLTVSGRENLVTGIEAGADDYITKPFDPSELRVRLLVADRITSLHRRSQWAEERIGFLEEQTRSRNAFQGMIGRTPVMQEVFRRLRLAAQSDVSVLLTGGSGTGKELAAKAIHALSARRDAPFLGVNCGAVPDTLLESELFGHARGSFTGADRDRPGLFEAAEGGTLFLDEIADVSQQFQLKLLRTLQEREVRRVGEEHPRKVNVRVIAASNQNLLELVTSGTLRHDFYYRIHVFEIKLPSLAERTEDIPLLVHHFIDEFSGSTRKLVRGIRPEALRRLMEHPWPGNVRELRHTIEHAFVVLDGPAIGLEHLPPEVRDAGVELPATLPEAARMNRAAPIGRALDRQAIEEALRLSGGNRTRAARALGVSRVTLWKRIREFGITPPAP